MFIEIKLYPIFRYREFPGRIYFHIRLLLSYPRFFSLIKETVELNILSFDSDDEEFLTTVTPRSIKKCSCQNK